MIFSFTFLFAWVLFEIDKNSEYGDDPLAISDKKKEDIILPGRMWLILLIGAIMLGISQTFTIILSGYAQRIFNHSNQEGGFLIVFFISL